MNDTFRLVWNQARRMLVPVSELAHLRRKPARGPRARRALARHALATAVGLALGCAASASLADTVVTLPGALPDPAWTTQGTVTILTTTDAFSVGGNPFSLTPAPGYSMAKIDPAGAPIGSVDTLLGLSANAIENLVGANSTNYGVLTSSYSFAAGTYTFAWAYAATDYQPYNDGVIFTLSGNGNEQVVSLARNGNDPSDLSGPSPGTLVLGSYGTTPWETATFTITTAGTYQFGFAAYNWYDTGLDPILYVSGIAGTYTGTPPPIGGGGVTVIGTTGGNVAANVFDTTSSAYAQPTLSFDGGTLQYIADTSTPMDGTLSANGGTLDTQSFTVSYDGVLSGAGMLTKIGSGTLTLTNENTYTGGTLVAAGTLALGPGGSLVGALGIADGATFDLSATTDGAALTTLAGAGDVVLGAQTLTLTAANDTFAGVIAGSGGLALTGGHETLTGTNTYTGGTLIADATLTVGADANLGGAAGGLRFDGGTLEYTGSFVAARPVTLSGDATLTGAAGLTLELAGPVAGDGVLTKQGDGTLVLSGDNAGWGSASDAALGGLVIEGGTVSVASATGLGHGAITLAAGTLGTTVNLVATQDLAVAPGTTLDVATGTRAEFSGALTGEGSGACVAKTGGGDAVLSGLGSLASGLCVDAGSVHVNGALVANVDVGTGALLRGTGGIAGDVNVVGTLAPGNSPGTLTVAGNVTLDPAATLAIDVNGTGTGSGPGNYSRLLVVGPGHTFDAGNATLAPNLTAIAGSGYTPYVPALGDTFRIVSAEGGLVGRFGTLVQPDGLASGTRLLAFYDTFGSASIDLKVAPRSYADYAAGDGGNWNAQRAAGAIDQIAAVDQAGHASATQDELLYLVASAGGSAITPLMTSLAGEIHGAMAAVAPAAGRWTRDAIARQLGFASATPVASQPAAGLWADASYDRDTWKADAVASQFDATRDAFVVGLDTAAGAGGRVGVALSHGATDVSAREGRGTEDETLALAYGQAQFGTLVVDASAGYGWSRWNTHRSDPLSASNTLATGVAGHSWLADLGVRRAFDAGRLVVEPYARVTWQAVSRLPFDEGPTSLAALTGAELATSGQQWATGLALRSSGADPLAATYTYQLRIGAAYDRGDLLQPVVDTQLAGAAAAVRAPEIGRTAFQAEAFVTLRLSPRVYAYLGAGGELRSNLGVGSATLGARYAF